MPEPMSPPSPPSERPTGSPNPAGRVDPPLQLVWGPAGHGVTDYGADVARAVTRVVAQEPQDRVSGIRIARVANLDEALGAAADATRVHLHVTDRLLGSSLEEAADALERLAAASRVTVTLHDLPQESDGTGYPRRVAAYARFVAAAAGVVVNSEHERRLVAEHLPGSPEPHVIPLGARVAAAPPYPADLGTTDLVVLLAGYVYPGKGHALALDAASDAVRALRADGHPVGRPVVRALGGVSPGHEADLALLQRRADERGARLEVTGFLADADFAAAMRMPGVPVAAHEHVSASRSMLDWVEAGRRPLVIASRYSREMAELRPDTTDVFEPEDLADRLVERWLAPERTRLDGARSLRPSLDDVAGDYLAWWRTEAPR
ncbi:hypothetical protein [Microbacterium radiodurans]|uniref:hypothetical protein n=1 Tax=Microbacterium radiodurans TaxID=661398 RepID=UPI001CC52B5A|nr:hypothetical protein [Microbacterium radiodurans]